MHLVVFSAHRSLSLTYLFMLQVCQHGKCINLPGSFKCICDDGFSMKTAVEEGCTDDDECRLDMYHCHPRAECKNTNGSYDCICREGFTGDGFDCEDINECLKDNGGCDQDAQCVNTEGGFRCVCDAGFSGDGWACQDIDECSEDPSLCPNGACLNFQGSFRCECELGFLHPKAGEEQRCEDIDECALLTGLCIHGVCENLRGSFRCRCDPGYQLDQLGGNCTDINECEEAGSCLHGTCVNLAGGHRCDCPPGLQLLLGGGGCVDRRLGTCYGELGRTVCEAEVGRGVGRSACCCGSGAAWAGPGTECQPCPPPGTELYKLVCPGGRGYQPNQETAILEDINECRELGGLCENGRCSNTFGSFMCSCSSGYRLHNVSMMCEDVDECGERTGLCDPGRCVNTEGGFECECPAGFMLAPDGKECIDMRKEMCWMQWEAGECGAAMSRPQTRMVCCCSMGAAWGEACQQCPEPHSTQHIKVHSDQILSFLKIV